MQSIVDHIYAGRSPGRILSRVSLGPGFYTAIQRNLVARDGNMNVVSLDLGPAFERILNVILDIRDLRARLNGEQIADAARRSMRSCTRKHGTAGIGNRIKSQILRFDLPPPLRRRRGRARELFKSPPSRERHSIRAWSLTSCEDRPQLQRIRVDDFEASPRLKSGDHERERSRHRFNTHPTSKSTAKTIPVSGAILA